MLTPIEFKAAFKQYMAKPESKRDARVVESLELQKKQMDEERKAIRDRFDLLKTKLSDKALDPAVKKQGRPLAQALNEAFKNGDHAEARELLDDIEALVSDAVGETTGAFEEVQRQRNEAAVAIFNKLKPPPLPKPGELEDAPEELTKLMKARSEAIAWQEKEIEGIEAAAGRLKALQSNVSVTDIMDWWNKQLIAIKKARTEAKSALTNATKISEAKQKAINAAEKEIDKLRKGAKTSQEWLDKNPDAKDDTPEDARARLRHTATVQDSDEEIRQEEQKLVVLRQEKQKADDDIEAAKLKMANIATKARNDFDGKMSGFNGKIDGETVSVPSFDFKKLSEDKEPDYTNFTADPEALFPDLERVANKHGTGRHGAQTGIEGQARRVASGLSPDQVGDLGGIGGALFNEDESEPTELGKRRRIASTPIASIFLSPELEKEAVDTARKAVIDNCPWTQVWDGAEWKPLKRVVVKLGKPAKAAGWGVAIKKIDMEGANIDPALANKAIEDFRRGRTSLDEMLKALGAALGTATNEKDLNDTYVNFVDGVTVVLDRVGTSWVNTTQVPAPVKAEEIGWDLSTKTVRIDENTPPVDNPPWP